MKKIIIFIGISMVVITALVYQTVNPIQKDITITNTDKQKNALLTFVIQNKSFIKFAAYDLTGKEVASLINTELEAGTYNVSLNNEKSAKGECFYKLTSENSPDIKKVTLTNFTGEIFSYK